MATSRDFPDMITSQEEEDLDRKFQTQVKAYVDWMNSQLKKKPGTRFVEDLKCDMQDGVALTDLVSIIADQSLSGTYPTPSNTTEMLANIQRVIDFMTEHRIKMHHTTANDILDGNVKAIMRLILALAAHYKPNSVKQSHRGTPTKGNCSMAGIAQSAAIALAEARRDASVAGNRPQRPANMSRYDRSDASHHQLSESSNDGTTGMSPIASANHRTVSPRGGASCKLDFGAMPKGQCQDFQSGQEKVGRDGPSGLADQISVDLSVLDQEYVDLEEDLNTTKQAILQLQQMLLSGQLPEGCDVTDDQQGAPVEAACPMEEVIILRSTLQQAEQHINQMREELSSTRTESMQLQGVKAGLQQRLTEQESSFLVLKAELLRAGFCQQSLENTKTELEQKLVDKDKIIQDVRKELVRREHQFDKLQMDFQTHQQHQANATHNIKAQLYDIHGKMKKVGTTEANLSSRMISQDKKLLKLESKILGPSLYDSQPLQSSSRSMQSHGSDDFHLVRESLRSLRSRFPGDDPQHQTIDALEQSISALVDRLNVTEQDSRWSDANSLQQTNFDSSGGSRRSPITSLQGSAFLDSSSNNGSTKVLYFTERTVTPFMCNIPKRLGEITLQDIKQLLDRHGNYRYHFKAMDPEFGTVKEEITNDDGIIPGWEGKIVAWIEEDHG